MFKRFLLILMIQVVSVMPESDFSQEWSAKDYNENSSLQFDAAEQLLSKYKFNLSDNILDIGCGNGKVTYSIAKKVESGSVVGIDAAPDMIKFANDNFKDLQNLTFNNINVCDLNFKNQFDHVFSFSCLHWVKDLKKAFFNISESLKADGKLLILMELQNDSPFNKALSEVLIKYNLEIDWYLYSQEEINTRLQEVGFKSIEFKDFNINKKFVDKTDLENWVASFPYGFNFSEDKRKQMILEIVEKYISYNPIEKDSSIFVVFPETVISATKN